MERLFHYGEKLEQEAPSHIPETQPPKDWPREGKVDAKDLVMAYRPGLPNVLKGLSMSVKGGEKIGVVGRCAASRSLDDRLRLTLLVRTGAGKSSIMMALFRIVELSGGEIEIDGVDVSKIGLDDLRRAVAIIPQEATLFNGTIRSNLDPFGVYDDARLWDALKRAGVVDRTTGAAAREAAKLKEIEGLDDASSSASDLAQTQQSPNRGGHSTPVNRYSLDSVVEDEGLNLSVGERSLVSLARALVKNSQIIVLDEATACKHYPAFPLALGSDAPSSRRFRDRRSDPGDNQDRICARHAVVHRASSSDHHQLRSHREQGLLRLA